MNSTCYLKLILGLFNITRLHQVNYLQLWIFGGHVRPSQLYAICLAYGTLLLPSEQVVNVTAQQNVHFTIIKTNCKINMLHLLLPKIKLNPSLQQYIISSQLRYIHYSVLWSPNNIFCSIKVLLNNILTYERVGVIAWPLLFPKLQKILHIYNPIDMVMD